MENSTPTKLGRSASENDVRNGILSNATPQKNMRPAEKRKYRDRMLPVVDPIAASFNTEDAPGTPHEYDMPQ